MGVKHWPGNTIEEKFVCGTPHKEGATNWSRILSEVTCKRCQANPKFIHAQKLIEETASDITITDAPPDKFSLKCSDNEIKFLEGAPIVEFDVVTREIKSPLEGRHNLWVETHTVKVGDLVMVVEKNTEDWPQTIIDKTNLLVGITASIKEILGQGFILEGTPTVVPYSMLEYLSAGDEIATQRPEYFIDPDKMPHKDVPEAYKGYEEPVEDVDSSSEMPGEFNLYKTLQTMYGKYCRHTLIPNGELKTLVISEDYEAGVVVGIHQVTDDDMTTLTVDGRMALKVLEERVKAVLEES